MHDERPIDPQETIALHRFSLIAEAANPHLSKAERGAVVRAIAEVFHPYPGGGSVAYSRGTLDRWIRDYRAKGLAGLRPVPRSDNGACRAHPELFSDLRPPPCGPSCLLARPPTPPTSSSAATG
ncbi:MAG: helix-turn-helix domain-containing protein [Acidimicrobiales bacterium]